MTNVVADTVLLNGVVFTADAKNRICEAIAIKDDKIVFVGASKEAAGYVGPYTQVYDLQGRMVIPGMIDTHIHPPGLALIELYEVELYNENSLRGYINAVKRFIDTHPGVNVVYGRGWSWGILTGEDSLKGPRKEYLDQVAPDIPVILRANDGHTLWVNSKALAVNGITSQTAVPTGGVIEKDEASGELWGTLKEAAMGLIALPAYSLEQYKAAMLAFQQKMHRFGITGILCMSSGTFAKIFAACGELEREGRLKLRIRGAMTVDPDDDLASQFARINKLRQQYNSPQLQVTTTKFFTDGVVEGGTSCLLEPYALTAGKGSNYYGDFLWDMDALQHAFCLANEYGLQIHVHSTGDASTKKVLDALALAQAKVPGNYRNTITHLQLVDKRDIQRFAQLNIIASVQPYWHFKEPNWWQQVEYKYLGNRALTEFPLRSFFDYGVVVTSSSDYPATLVPNPLLAIEIGVTRNIDNGDFYGVEDITHMDDPKYLLNKDERATIEQMLRSFTINGAYALFMEVETGSLEVGKQADMAVLDHNLLTINPLDIDKVKVMMTFFNGELVYERDKV